MGMIDYWAETALCGLLYTPLIGNAAARRLLQNLFVTDADLRPDAPTGLLHVEVHRGSRPAVDRALETLFSQLNEMELSPQSLHSAQTGGRIQHNQPAWQVVALLRLPLSESQLQRATY